MPPRRPPDWLKAEDAPQPSSDTGLQWTPYYCSLLTPLIGGGTYKGRVNHQHPIRASGIRGALRFWWRLLARNKYKLDETAAREDEFQVWGGLGQHAAQLKASQVWVRIRDLKHKDTKHQSFISEGALRYALFPLGHPPDPQGFIPPPLSWTLELALNQNRPAQNGLPSDSERLNETLLWWASFGGVGARTRRGLGAIRVERQGSRTRLPLASITPQQAQEAGCELVLTEEHSTHIQAWQAALQKLQDFRQGRNLGRNPGKALPGQSRWPEAAALRRYYRQHRIKHDGTSFRPGNDAPLIFPRAAFGLPIVFKFKNEQGSKPGSHPDQDHDPHKPISLALTPRPDSHSQGADSRAGDRFASPLILRAYPKAGGKAWQAAALKLPLDHQLPPDASLELSSALRAPTHTHHLLHQHPTPDERTRLKASAPGDWPQYGVLEAFMKHFKGNPR